MTRSRQEQIHLDSTPFYHCYVRCVRRAFLCGTDHFSGQNFDHRKQWLVSRLRFLSYVYAIDICAYAVMSNHYHVVLHVDKKRAENWSLEEVAQLWLQLYSAPLLVQKWLKNPTDCDKTELEVVTKIVEQWRTRLHDMGWFMRGINEVIARMANAEDKTKGRFWEGRYKSQALLDEVAVLSCMAYVDLNPVRAGICEDNITSDFTSIQQRLFNYAQQAPQQTTVEQQLMSRIDAQIKIKEELNLHELPEGPLMPFDGANATGIHTALPFTQEDYITLVDTTGRCIREDKKGFIPAQLAPILQRLGVQPKLWLHQIQHFGRTYGSSAGSANNILAFAGTFNRKWGKGVGTAKKAYTSQVVRPP